MNSKVAVLTPNKYLWDAVQAHQRGELKKLWSDSGDCHVAYKGQEAINISGERITQGYQRFYTEEGYELISVDEDFRRYGKDLEPLKSGTYAVTAIDSTGFKVGCQAVTWVQYDEIGKRRPKA